MDMNSFWLTLGSIGFPIFLVARDRKALRVYVYL